MTGRAAQGRRLALLALLALARGRPIPRDKLLALLWPESPTDRARHQLSDAVYIVRDALGEDAIRSVSDELVLNPAVIASDVGAFEQLLDAGDLEPAFALYAGPLLDGFHVSGAADFERWLDGERVRLGQRYAAALGSLAEASEGRDDFTTAVGWWRRLAAHDPYSGRVALRLMRALEAAGDRAGALQHARAHATLLRDEFEAEPDPDVTAFAERLRLEPVARSAPQPVAPGRTPGPAPEVGVGRRPTRDWGAAAAVLLLVVTGLSVYVLRTTRGASPAARSVAVLPFVNMSADPANTYFSDGLSEEIIAALSRVDGLRVAARTSSFALRDRSLDVRAIGDTLGVRAVLEGSVRKDGNRLRVTAQLIDAASGHHLWSDEYDRELKDVFALQQDIAGAIVAALKLRWGDHGPAPRTEHRPDLEAYDLYLRGLYLRNSLRADALSQAREFFDRAIGLEPGFALAYAAKASVVAPQIFFGYLPRDEGVRELRALTARALELDPELGEAHVALGILKLFFDWDWPGAERALRRAIALAPNDPHAYHHLANYLDATGRLTEAITARERSVELDPLNARTRFVLGAEHVVTGKYDAALAQYRRAFQLDPVNALALGLGSTPPKGPADVYQQQGRYDEAAEELLKVATLRDATAGELHAIRGAYADDGMPGFWRRWLDMDIRQSSSTGGTPNPVRLATLWALVGDTAQTFHWLDRAYAERNPGLIFVQREPAFEKLRTHPRFARIVNAMKLPTDASEQLPSN